MTVGRGLSVQSGAAVWQRLLSNFKYSCLQPTATNARPLFTPDLLRRVQFLACTACRVVIRLNTLARGGSRVRATLTVPRLQVRPVVSNNEKTSNRPWASCTVPRLRVRLFGFA